MKFLLPIVGLMIASSASPALSHVKHGHRHHHYYHHHRKHRHYHHHYKTGVTLIHKHKHGHGHGHHGVKHYHVIPPWLFRVTIH